MGGYCTIARGPLLVSYVSQIRLPLTGKQSSERRCVTARACCRFHGQSGQLHGGYWCTLAVLPTCPGDIRVLHLTVADINVHADIRDPVKIKPYVPLGKGWKSGMPEKSDALSISSSLVSTTIPKAEGRRLQRPSPCQRTDQMSND